MYDKHKKIDWFFLSMATKPIQIDTQQKWSLTHYQENITKISKE